MPNIKNMGRKFSALTCLLVLAAASLLPAVLSHQKTFAAQPTERSITMGTSVLAASSVTYSVSFKPATSTGNAADDIKGIVVDFCQDSPLIGTACTKTNGISAIPTSGTVAVAHTGATGTPVNFTAQTPDASITAGTALVITDSTGLDTITPANTITFSFTATNPTDNDSVTGGNQPGTFYARILTFNTTAGATNYQSAAPGTHLDSGGVALSTANQLTTTARVQEQLAFCVGGTTVDDATTSVAASCAAAFTGSGTCGNTVDLGIIDNTAVSISPVPTAAGTPGGGNACNGAAMVRTNASNGVSVSYFPEAGSGTNHTRALRVPGATCAADGIPSAVTTDQCFNSSGPTQNSIAAGTEEFGLTVAGINCGSTSSYTCTFSAGTYNMVRDAEYDGAGNNTYTSGAGNDYAWSESSTAAFLASSTASTTKVVDDETLILKFAGAAGITTPTGSYSVTSTYIATAIF